VLQSITFMSKKLKHDKIIRSAFENPFVAREFFEMHLPSHIKGSLVFETLKMEKDSFVDKTLKKSILDILFLLNLIMKMVTYFYY